MPQRLDQIEELTRGVELPLLPLHHEHLLAIVDVLCSAWADLLQKHPRTLFHEDEPAINALMETRLLALLDDNQLWGQMVRAVARGRETMSFDGTHLEKRPDLSVYLTRQHNAFPLIIECKIIDKANNRDGKLYCDKGVSRFLTGEYAWASQEAILIAYVRDKSTVVSTLTPLFMALPSGLAPYGVQDTVSLIGVPPPDLAKSRHNRGFRYPLRQPPLDDPGPIALWHLWLPAAP